MTIQEQPNTGCALARYDRAMVTMASASDRLRPPVPYLLEYRKFCLFCRDEVAHLPRDGYITSHNVNLYFSTRVILRHGRHAAVRIRVALQWFYDKVERPEGPPFRVRSAHTESQNPGAITMGEILRMTRHRENPMEDRYLA